MLARIWTGETRSHDADRYTEYLTATGVADVRATPGNRGALVLRRGEGEKERFEFLSFWDSLEAIRAFAGADVERARYYPEDERYLLSLVPTVEHFEVVAARGLTDWRRV